MNVGDVIAGRFEIIEAPRRGDPTGLDRVTGRRARLVLAAEPGLWFLDRAAERAAAKVVRALDDQRIAAVLCLEPLLVEAAPDPLARWPLASVVDAALEMIALDVELGPRGLATIPGAAWIAEGGVRVPVAPARSEWHFQRHRFTRTVWDGQPLAQWLTNQCAPSALVSAIGTQRSPRSVALALAAHASDPASARTRAAVFPEALRARSIAVDLDETIEEGQRAHALDRERNAERGERYPDLRERMLAYTAWALAATRHRRACVRWMSGDVAGAEEDLACAIELDPHPQYLTTRALWREARGEDALEAHDQAVAALARTRPPPPLPPLDPELYEKPRGRKSAKRDAEEARRKAILDERWRLELERSESMELADDRERGERDAARTLLARGAYLARRGQLAAARVDVEAALAAERTPLGERWLAWIERHAR